ncbi:MAG: hypothetical protein KDA87_10235, partial [Planctomycetales bacterium]|nr:hypothetical protein [Planctomycetales bacterium]
MNFVFSTFAASASKGLFTMFRVVALVVIAFMCLSFPAACAGMEAGVAKTVITPDPLLPISG